MRLDKWFDDIPQQFLGKKNIEVLIKAFSRQLEELAVVYEQLNTLTNLNEAQGYNLDMVGDIACLSRRDATSILRKSKDTELTDDIYRQTLKYNVLKNNCECTFEDIIEAINILWKDNHIVYREDPALPATICLYMPDASLDGEDPSVNRVLSIKPAGVALTYFITYLESFYIPIDYDTAIRIMMDWGARNDKRFLDATWELDGTMYLSGAVGESFDFTPVKNILTDIDHKVEITTEMEPPGYGIYINSDAEFGDEHINIAQDADAIVAEDYAASFLIPVEVPISTEARAVNALYLSGDWALDEGIALKGGITEI